MAAPGAEKKPMLTLRQSKIAMKIQHLWINFLAINYKPPFVGVSQLATF
jgi:hypothetical protein